MTKKNIGGWEITSVVVPRSAPRNPAISQVHGTRIVGAHEDGEADGVLVTKTDSAAGVRTADCAPVVFMADTDAAVLHVSRHTLVAGQLDALSDRIDPATLSGVYVGPRICPQHFVFPEAGEGIVRFRELFPYAVSEGAEGWHVDIAAPVVAYVKKWQLPTEKIIVDAICTYEDEALPSYCRSLARGKAYAEHLYTTAQYVG